MSYVMKSTFIAAIVAASVGGCGEQVAPANPTWEADVYPIVQGQCLHCHGDEADDKGNGFRFDFRDLDKCGDLGLSKAPNFTAPSLWLGSLVGDGSARARMPPTPANTIEDWQYQTLKNYDKRYRDSATKEKTRGTRTGNHKPKIIITSQYPDKVGDELKVSYRFEDTDGDPVIGVLKFGDAKVDLLKFSGQVTLSGFTAQSGDTLTLTADICDGWGRVTTDLKDIEKE